jgi:hypothetical protein
MSAANEVREDERRRGAIKRRMAGRRRGELANTPQQPGQEELDAKLRWTC